jgi:hypothetical protein
LITILREIGLRVGALSCLRYGMVVDEHHMPRATCVVPEKNKSNRAFITSPNLRAKVKMYVEKFRSSHPQYQTYQELKDLYLFNISHPTQPLGTSSIRRTIKKLADDAQVTGIHAAHPHAFRHTIVGKLIKVGNSMEVVSKFLGHRFVSTTADNYWVTTIQDLVIKNPYMGDWKEDEEQPLVHKKEELSATMLLTTMNIISSYNKILRDTKGKLVVDALKQIERQLPNLDNILNSIAQHMREDTSTIHSATTC